jgi:foldase protein PrsA
MGRKTMKEKTKTISSNIYNLLIATTIVLGLGFIVMVYMYVSGGKVSNDEIAFVDKTAITKDQVYEETMKTNGKETLNQLINNTVIQKELEKQEIKLTQEEIDAEKKKITDTFPDEKAFKEALKTNKITEQQFEDDIVKFLKINKILEKRVEVTDAEIKAEFDANKSHSVIEEAITANHILVKTKELAEEVKTKLDGGAKFAELAKEYSVDEQNKAQGGSLGTFQKGMMEKEFEEVAFKMKKGEISGPVKTSFGFHIIEVTDKTEATTKTFEEVKEVIKGTLTTKKIDEEFAKWIEEVKKNYEIKIN